MYTPVTISWCWSAFKLPSLSPEGANKKNIETPTKTATGVCQAALNLKMIVFQMAPRFMFVLERIWHVLWFTRTCEKLCFRRQDSTVWWLVLALQRDWQWGFNLPSMWLSHPPSCESLLHAIGSSFTGTWKKYGTMACSIAMLVLFTRRVCRIMLLSLFKFHLSILDQPLILYFHIGTLLVEHSSQVATWPESLWFSWGSFAEPERPTSSYYSYFLTSCWTEDFFVITSTNSHSRLRPEVYVFF